MPGARGSQAPLGRGWLTFAALLAGKLGMAIIGGMQRRAEAKIRNLARHDNLTGLANRAVFVEALQEEMASMRRGGRSFAVLYLDLDHFKDVNDALAPLATCSCKRWPSGCRRAFVRRTSWRGSAATNSRCSSPICKSRRELLFWRTRF